MRIAMVSEHASPLAVLGGEDAGGQNVHVAALSRALAARGHDVTIYTRRDDSGSAEVVALYDGVDVAHVPAGPPEPLAKDLLLPYMPRFAAWLRDTWARDRPPDVVHAHFWMSGLAALDARCHGVPRVVQTFHALGTVKRRHQGNCDTSPPERIALETSIIRRADAVIATCTDEVRELTAMTRARTPIHVAPCGVQLENFTPHGPRAQRGEQPFRLVYAGRLVERKGISTIVEALPNVRDAELVIAGGPAREDIDRDREIARLRRLAVSLGVDDRVRFVGRLPHEGVAALFRSADLVVTTPWYEPFGIVPLEAMACGVPVVASAVGGMLDTVLDDRTGKLVPPNDPIALAAVLNSLLRDEKARRCMGRAGARHVAQRYAWSRVAAQCEAIYAQQVELSSWKAAV